MKNRLALSFLPLALAACAQTRTVAAVASPLPDPIHAAGLDSADRIRIAEAFRLSRAVGDSVWPGWSAAPFGILLVTADREFLIGHERPDTTFTAVGHDPLIGAAVLTRARRTSPNLLATYPAVNGVSTIVIGQPAATGLTSTRWVLTLLHEHLHQVQNSQPGYYSGVNALGLSRGDGTGMWMLNFPFPYDSLNVRAAYDSLAATLDRYTSGQGAGASWSDVTRARAALRSALSADDDRYLAFQLWQEGAARYTELAFARMASQRHTPTPQFAALADFTSYSDAAERIERGIRNGLRDGPLGRQKRVAFYALGAALALGLDKASPAWRRAYFARPFQLESHAR